MQCVESFLVFLGVDAFLGDFLQAGLDNGRKIGKVDGYLKRRDLEHRGDAWQIFQFNKLPKDHFPQRFRMSFEAIKYMPNMAVSICLSNIQPNSLVIEVRLLTSSSVSIPPEIDGFEIS